MKKTLITGISALALMACGSSDHSGYTAAQSTYAASLQEDLDNSSPEEVEDFCTVTVPSLLGGGVGSEVLAEMEGMSVPEFEEVITDLCD